MTISTMFGQSFVVMLLGVAVVFGFLILLILAITVTGKVIHALGLDREAKPAPAAMPVNGLDNGIVAAIGAAIKTYRKE
jgi:oxaloacetate decarboxylase gamma subunit